MVVVVVGVVVIIVVTGLFVIDSVVDHVVCVTLGNFDDVVPTVLVCVGLTGFDGFPVGLGLDMGFAVEFNGFSLSVTWVVGLEDGFVGFVDVPRLVFGG